MNRPATAISCLLLLLLALPVGTRAEDVGPAADYLAPEVILFCELTNTSELIEKYKKTSYYDLLQVPEVQSFVKPLIAQLEESYEELIAKLWEEMELDDPPAELPLPTGQVGFAMFLNIHTVEEPDFSKIDYESMTEADWEDFDPSRLPTRTSTRPVPDFLFWADLGEQISVVEEFMDSVDQKARKDDARLHRETVRGIEMTFYQGEPDESLDYDAVGYAFHENTFMMASSLPTLRNFIMRLRGSDEPVLSEQPHFRTTMKTLEQGDVKLFLNVPPLFQMLRRTVEPSESEQVEKILNALAVEQINGFGAIYAVAPEPQVNILSRALIAIDGPPTGLMKLLTPESQPLMIDNLVHQNTGAFYQINYDPADLYRGILALVQQIGGMNPEFMLQGALAMTGGTGEGAKPPVNLRLDIIDKLTTPMLFQMKYDKPFSSPDSIKLRFDIKHTDAKILTDALKRVHTTFIARAQPDTQREFLESTIFTIPNTAGFSEAFSPISSENAEQAEGQDLAFAVTETHLSLGTTGSVEQALRDQRREDFTSLTSNPLFRHTRRFLPDKAGMYAFENTHQTLEHTLWSLQQVWDSIEDEFDIEDWESEDDVDARMHQLFKDLLAAIDPANLPDYSLIKPYMGIAIGAVRSVDNGLLLESYDVRSPDEP